MNKKTSSLNRMTMHFKRLVFIVLLGIGLIGMNAYGQTKKSQRQRGANYHVNPVYREINNYLKTNSLDALQDLSLSKALVDSLTANERQSLYLLNVRPIPSAVKPLIFNLIGFGLGSYMQGNTRAAIISTLMTMYTIGSVLLIPSMLYYHHEYRSNEVRYIEGIPAIAYNTTFLATVVKIVDVVYGSVEAILYVKRYNWALKSFLSSDTFIGMEPKPKFDFKLGVFSPSSDRSTSFFMRDGDFSKALRHQTYYLNCIYRF